MSDKKYLQHELILSIEDVNDEFVRVTVKNEETGVENTQKISKALAPYIFTDEPTDPTKLQDLTVEPMVKEILAIFVKYDPRLEDIKVALQRSRDTLMRNVERADDLKYGMSYLDRRLHIYHELLLDNEFKEIPSGK